MYLDTISLSCESGYEYENGSSTIACQSDRQWNDTSLFCKRVSCGIPQVSDNSSVSNSQNLFGDTITYTCDTFYRASGGDASRNCSADGTWTGDALICERITSIVSVALTLDMPYKEVYNNMTHPTTKQFISDVDSKLTQVYVGNVQGFWSVETTHLSNGSVIIDHNVLVNGTLSSDELLATSVQVVEALQNQGGILTVGNINATIKDVFNNFTSAINCSQPVGEDPNARRNGSSLFYGDVIEYECNVGYTKASGEEILTCLSNRTWDGVPLQCQRVSCGMPTVPVHTLTHGNDTLYQDTISLSCESGYEYENGSSTIVCQHDGQWNDTALFCRRVSCGNPNVGANSSVTNSDNLFGDNVTYSCDQGFEIFGGNVSRVCSDDMTWTGAALNCQRVSCGQPIIPMHTLQHGNDTLFLDTISLSCESGYEYENGSSTIACQEDRQWNDTALFCRRVSCGNPGVEANSSVTNNDNLFGDNVTYTCDRGFEISSGNVSRVCNDDKTWTGGALNCQRVSCGQPTVPTNTLQHGNDTLFLDTISLSCGSGYEYENGSSSIVCQEDRQWNDTALFCRRVSCGIPDVAANSTVTSSDNLFGDNVTYTCDSGFEISDGNVSRLCSDNRTWTGAALDCQRVSCGQPIIPMHTLQHGNDTLFLDTISLSCDSGYEYENGSSTIVCQEDRQWNDTALFCRPVSCGNPDVEANSSVTNSENLLGDNVTYSCDIGFEISGGNVSRMCSDDGTWTGTALTCQRVSCGQPSIPTHTLPHGNDTLFLDTISLSCESGYDYENGSSTIVCQQDRQWNDTALFCRRVSCGNPDVGTNSSVTNSQNLFGDAVTYTCDNFYRVSGGDTLRNCSAYGTWTGVALTCERITSTVSAAITLDMMYKEDYDNMTHPNTRQFVSNLGNALTKVFEGVTGFWSVDIINLSNGSVIVDCNVLLDGSLSTEELERASVEVVEAINNQGGVLTIGNISTTIVDVFNNYTSAINCSQPVGEDPNTVRNGSSLFYGDVIEYKCAEGYTKLSGEEILTCLSNTSWDREPLQCQRIDCGNPSVPIDTLQHGNDTLYLDTISLSCPSGYEYVNGSSTIVCQKDGQWNDTALACRISTCGEPDVGANSSVTSSPNLIGDNVTYSCDLGYEVSSGNISRMCGGDGQWSGSAVVCRRVSCGTPSIPANTLQTGQGTLYTDTLSLGCSFGYEFHNGSYTLTCLANGTWEGTPLHCKPVSCGEPRVEANSSVTQTSNVFGDNVTYTCDFGFEKSGGNVSRLCGADGNWTGSPLTCQSKECGEPIASQNAIKLKGSSYAQGDIVDFTCRAGYTPYNGSDSLLCLSSGNWNDTALVCEEINECESAPCQNNGTCNDAINSFSCDCSPAYTGALCENEINCTQPVNNSFVQQFGSSFTPGDVVSFVCDPGYKPVNGSSSVLCLLGGQWNDSSLFCEEIDECESSPCKHGGQCSHGINFFTCNCTLPWMGKTCQQFRNVRMYPTDDVGLVKASIRYPAKLAHLGRGLTFGTQTYTKLFIHKYGLISFGSRVGYAVKYLDQMRTTMLAVFWRKQLFNYDSRIVYQEYYRFKTDRSQHETDILDIATNQVRLYEEIPDFTASWVLVVTWDKMGLYCYCPSSTFTYQAVLISDGVKFFALYNYGEISAGSFFAMMGYKDRQSGDFFAPYFVATYGMYDIEDLPGNLGNKTDFTGSWMFRLDKSSDDASNIDKKCLEWAEQQTERTFRSFPSCPSTRMQARNDRRYRYRRSERRCYVYRFKIFRIYGLSCCYDDEGALITSMPDAGSFHQYSYRYRGLHRLNDILPYEWCCVDSDNCDVYYKYRPVIDSSGYRPPRRGRGVGDPHMTSVDGKQFTFNGHGQFTLLDYNGGQFAAEARLARLQNANGTELNATVYSAFAGKDNDSDSVHVELSPDKQSVAVYVNSVLQEGEFEDKDFNNVMVTRSNTSATVSFTSEFTFTVTASVGTLAIAIEVPSKATNKTFGLFGSVNANTDDDFTYPNGTILHANATEREIFSYGQSWLLKTQGSFMYKSGETQKTFEDPLFVPVFSDEIVATQVMKDACGDNAECLFDYAVSRDPGLASSTRITEEESKKLELELARTPPTLNGTLFVHATIGQPATISLTATDVDGDVVTIHAVNENRFPQGILLSNQSNAGSLSVSLSWTPVDMNGTFVGFFAKDSSNLTSGVHIVAVQLSPDCQNGATSQFVSDSDLQISSTKSVYLVTCDCTTGWEGDDCSIDIDGCSGSPCAASGTNCTDLTPSEEQQRNVTFECGPCGQGFEKLYGDCIDIDECVNSTLNKCDQTCLNKDNGQGYSCACNDGYTLAGEHTCQDVDECSLSNPCDQGCQNMPGTFQCTCLNGYTLTNDNVTCELGSGQDLCSVNNLNCSHLCLFNTTSGDYKCGCRLGYELDGDGKTCNDINECNNATYYCSQPHHCNNTEGGYTCGCDAGFKLAEDKITCTPCDVLHWGEGCSNLCNCGSRSLVCNATVGCSGCVPGWQGDGCTTDVNECNDPKACPANAYCINKEGSYACRCNDGYERSSNGTCVDKDECENGEDTCHEQATCINTPGNYTCICNEGFIGDGNKCADIDECSVSNVTCHAKASCSNTVGSFTCKCRPGLSGDGRTDCFDIDECAFGTDNCDPMADCVNIPESFNCTCKTGYEGSGTSCTDIDECATNTDDCHHNATCTNNAGSFVCSCLDGFSGNGTFCENIDECTVPSHDCHQNATCTDTVGNFTCACKDGYQGDGRSCENIDECADANLNNCSGNATCFDAQPSYTCSCNSGYTDVNGNGFVCEDINECASNVTNNCSQICINEPGAHRCDCNSGYRLTNDKNTCADIDECSESTHQCEQVCSNDPGGYTCTCDFGALNPDSFTCNTSVALCGALNCSYGCRNGSNGLECFCQSGFEVSSADNYTCTPISCGSPPNEDPNATRFGSSFSFADSVNYTCKAGYETTSGQSRITCKSNGNWTDDPLRCQRVNCGSVQVHPDTIQSGNSTLYQDTITFSCPVGYEYVNGSYAITCLDSGQWNATALVCQPVSCGMPHKEANSNVSSSSNLYGDTATYACDVGYEVLSGNTSRTCAANGNWSGDALSCDRVSCGQPAVPTNTLQHDKATLFLDTISLSCESGYEYENGSSTIVCQQDRQWNDTALFCRRVSCGNPDVSANSVVTSSENLFGDNVTYSCNSGYEISGGNVSRVCSADMTWTGAALTCQRVNCGVINVAANTIQHGNATLYEDTVSFSCANGYEFKNGSETIVCLHTGQWNASALECQRVSCGEPGKEANTTVSNADNLFGDNVTYRCDVGYEVSSGNVSRECGADGAWTGVALSCQRVNCGPVHVSYGTVQDGNATLYQDTIAFSCASGYQYVNGSNSIHCLASGEWNDTALVCERVSCGQPYVEVNTNASVGSTKFGDNATYNCDVGHERIGGNFSRVCGADGNWTGKPLVCQRVNCGVLSSPANTLQQGNGTLYENTRSFTCANGYEFENGSSSVTCLSSGSWNDTALFCKRVTCGKPNVNSNSRVNGTSYFFEDVLTYGCDEGYVITGGNTTRVCGANRNWTGSALQCSRISCGAPNVSATAVQQGNGTLFEDTISFTCQIGQKYISGGYVIECSASGKWNDTSLTCSRKSCGLPEQPPNTAVIGNSYMFGDNITYSCNDGYEITGGNVTRKCAANSNWTGSPLTCQRKSCGQPVGAGPNTIKNGSSYLYEDVVQYTCTTGYRQSSGKANLTCLANATWDDSPLLCQRVDCSAPSVPPTTVQQGNSTLYEDTISFTCPLGQRYVNGSYAITCTDTGAWNGSALLCSRKSCGKPDEHPNTVVTGNSYLYGDVVTYSCGDGYEVTSGNASRACGADTNWTGSALSCQRKSCGSPSGEDPNTVKNGSSYLYQDEVHYACATGYRPKSGESNITCLSNTSWDGIPLQCQRVDCGAPTVPLGTIQHGNGTLYEDTVSFTCPMGERYTSGSYDIVCTDTGAWNASALSCSRKSCGIPDSQPNTIVSGSSYLYGDAVTYSCGVGYEMASGNVSRTCQANTNWTGSALSCQRVNCGAVVTDSNTVTVRNDGTLYGDIMTFACAPTYRPLSGSDAIECGVGVWNSSVLVCEVISTAVDIAVKLNLTFTDRYKNLSDSETVILVRLLETALTGVYKDTIPGFLAVRIKSLQRGSVVVNHEVLVNGTISDAQKQSVGNQAAGAILSNGVLQLGDQVAVVQDVSGSGGAQVTCASVGKFCKQNGVCKEVDSILTCSCPFGTSGSRCEIGEPQPLEVYISVGIVGGLIVIVAVLLLIFFCVRRSRQREKKDKMRYRGQDAYNTGRTGHFSPNYLSNWQTMMSGGHKRENLDWDKTSDITVHRSRDNGGYIPRMVYDGSNGYQADRFPTGTTVDIGNNDLYIATHNKATNGHRNGNLHRPFYSRKPRDMYGSDSWSSPDDY